MGWDKTTVNRSNIDAIVDRLTRSGRKHVLEELTLVLGRGWNDKGYYPLRRLSYTEGGKKVFVQEIMLRAHDCDLDDYLESRVVQEQELPYLLYESYYDEE